MKKIFKKKNIIIGILIVGIIIIVSCIIFIGFVSDAEKIRDEYQKLNGRDTSDNKKYPEVNISKDNKLVYSNVEEIVDIFASDGDAVIYFGYAECLYCRSAIEVLCDASYESSLDKIYYLDVNKDIDYSNLVKLLRSDFIIDNNKIYSPLVIFVVDGEIISYNKGTLFSQDDPYERLDEWQVKGLKEIYSYGIRDVVSSINNKKDNE